jgi:quercetin dioxygenase-like cupin family protein
MKREPPERGMLSAKIYSRCLTRVLLDNNEREVSMKLACSKMSAVVALVAFVGAGWIPAVYAQEPPKVTRKVLLKQDTTIPDREAVVIAVELQPGSEEGRHTHPAELYAVVQEGTLLLESEGKETVTYKVGDAFYVAPGKVHNGKNNGTVTTRLTAFMVAEKGKPLSTPAK